MSAAVGSLEAEHSFLVGRFFWRQQQVCLSPAQSFQRPGGAGARMRVSTGLQAPGLPLLSDLGGEDQPPKPGMSRLSLTEVFGYRITASHFSTLRNSLGNQEAEW